MKIMCGSSRSWGKNCISSSAKFSICFTTDKFVSWEFTKTRPMNMSFFECRIRSLVFKKEKWYELVKFKSKPQS